MTSMVLRDVYCPIGGDCPAIERPDGGGFDVTGTRVDRPGLPEHEATVHLPDEMLPELADLAIPDFMTWLASHRATPGDVLRVQTLDRYGVPADDQDYVGYTRGAPEPQSPHREPWFARLRTDTAADRRWRNVHIVRTPLSDYLRYACEWGYAYTTAAGQDVRILDVAEHTAAEALFTAGDFWVIDAQHVVLCRYDEQGHPLGTVGVGASSTAAHIALADLAWQLATPFGRWWAAHPQFHRARPAA